MKNIFKELEKKYVIKLCNSKELIEKAKEIRYKVYCEEKSYENINENKKETDDLDEHSEHFIAFDKKTNQAVATFRMICTETLPSETKLNLYSIDKKIGKSIELSRFAALPEARGQSSSRLAVGLFLASAYASWILKAKHVYVEMERALAISAKRTGISSTKLTPFFEHNGQRAIYLMSTESVIDNLLEELTHPEKISMFNTLCDFDGLNRNTGLVI